MAAQIPWDEAFETLLFDIVILKKAHVCGRKSVTATWQAVHDSFYEQPEMQPHQQTKSSVRKVRDKYKSLIKRVKQDIETGNQSGKDGELNKLYKKVQFIEEEVVSHDADKEADTRLKNKLNVTEEEILQSSGHLKRKLLNPPLSFDEKLDLWTSKR